MTKEDLKEAIVKIRLAYDNPKFVDSKEAFDVWYEALEDLRSNQFSEAVKLYIRTKDRLPKPSNIRECYYDMDYKDEGWQ